MCCWASRDSTERSGVSRDRPRDGADRRNCVHERDQVGGVVTIGRRESRGQRGASPIGKDVILRPGLAPNRRVGPVSSPPRQRGRRRCPHPRETSRSGRPPALAPAGRDGASATGRPVATPASGSTASSQSSGFHGGRIGSTGAQNSSSTGTHDTASSLMQRVASCDLEYVGIEGHDL
jgi:hypothetical protein